MTMKFCWPSIIVTLLYLHALAYTPAQTNDMARSLLWAELQDVEDDLDVSAEYPCASTNWLSFIGADESEGWKTVEKEAAINYYLSSMATNNCLGLDGETKELLRIGLCVLRDYDHTNALSIIRCWSLNPQSVHRTMAIDLFYSWSKIDEAFYETTAQLLTNTVSLTRDDIRSTTWGVVGALQRTAGDTSGIAFWRTNVVELLYRTRCDQIDSAIPLDRLFVADLANYETSTNRLQTVNQWLTHTNCTPEMAAYFAPITNRLATLVR